MDLRPNKGGFLRPFGCGWFIREFLMGHTLYGNPSIKPSEGACQEDIFYYYKLALIRAYAEDAAVREEERIAEREKRRISPEKIEELTAYYSERIPYKLHRARYHSFSRYFHWLKQLEWVEFTGVEEASAIGEYYPDAPKRRYYRLTRKGIEAPDYEWSRPQLYAQPMTNGIPTEQYQREKRKERHYYTRKR
jgi:hypothetical protein